MTLLIPHHEGWKLTLSAVLALLMIVQCVWAMEPETCYSRQHQRAIVNVRQALTKQGVLMDARVVRSERDCVLACCSEEVKPGAKCNMAVFNGNKQPGEDNCFLFHCVTEQDCPLMKAADGINTYDIYKGLIHLTTARPTATTVLPITSTPTPRTTSTPPTTTTTTTTTTTSTTTQTPTTMPPPTTTHQSPTTTPALESEPPPRLIIISPIPAAASTTTTTTTEVTSTSIRRPNKTSKKQNKNTKKGRLHPVITKTTPVPTSATTTLQVIMVDQEEAYRTADKPQPKAELCTTTPSTTTTTTTPATTTTTTTPMPTTTTTITSTTTTTTTIITSTAPPPTTSTATVPPTTSTTTKEKFNLITTTPAVSLLIVPKGVVQPEHPLQDQSQAKSATLGRGAVKSGVVAFMVLGLAVLTMALAIGGRKAMESFDRRHYTRLELNDLHYEV